jgi:hypothetical protein
MPLLSAGQWCVLLLLAHGLTGSSSPQVTAAASRSNGVALFLEQVGAYTELRKGLAASLPPLGKDPTVDAITARERALADRIVKARGSAREGDVFVPAARTHIRRELDKLLSGVKGAERLAAIQEERSERRLTARVNARYLDGIPVSMVPPDMLSALPKLPREVEYHFLERHLILLDGDARIIVDVLRDVLPAR